MFCPNCGTQLPDDSKFCSSCGGKLTDVTTPVEVEVEQPQVDAVPVQSGTEHAFVKPQKKFNIKKIAVVAIAAVVIIAAVVGIGKLLSSGGSKNAYVYVSNNAYELITNLKEEGSIQIASSKSDYVMPDMVTFSPDGKYVYYYTKFDYYSETGTLCRAEYGKLKENSNKNDKYIEVIASNVQLDFQFTKDNNILYLNGEDTLYYFDGKETTQLAKNINGYAYDDSDRIVYITGEYEEGYTLYGVTLSDLTNPVKLASNVYYIWNHADFDNILYVKEEDNYSQTLYVVGFDKEAEKLLENADPLTRVDGKSYILAENGTTLSLYDFVEDANAASDMGIVEPDEADFVIPEYTYKMIYEHEAAEEADFSELYTSCTKALYWFGESTWWTSSMENALDETWGDDTVKIHTAVQKFIDKYASTADEYGYIRVTDEVKAALQEINNARSGEDVQEWQWLWLCFDKYQSGTTLDYDAYYDAYDKWEAAEDRILLRERLKDPENDFPVSTLYCYENGVLTAVNETVLDTTMYGSGFMYNTTDMVADTVKLEDVDYLSEIYDLFEVDPLAENYVVNTTNGNVSRMSVRTAEMVAEAEATVGAELYVADKAVYMEDGSGLLSMATISNGVVGNFENISDDASVLSVDGSVLYYISGAYENNDALYCDLYSCKNGETTLLARDVLYENIQLYEDGVIMAYTGYRSSSGYELSMINAKGEMTLIADSVDQYIRVDKSTLLYISDGDLYYYNGKEKTFVQYGVEWLWSQHAMVVEHNFGYYYSDYDYDEYAY